MFHQLVSHNEDIRRLVEKGYAVSFDSGHLVVRDIPYLNENKDLRVGAIVTKLDFIDKHRVQQVDHQVFFCGTHPHETDGTAIRNFGGGPVQVALSSADLAVQRSFSNKPVLTGAFANFFDKIESYVTIISGPAMALYDVNPYTFKMYEPATDSVFHYSDTLTSRAEIGDLALNFKNDKIAIIGVGGTGSYVLDFLAKTPVLEIHGFDKDPFHVHNAFRSPGKLEEQELGRSKAEVYQNRYQGFRKGIQLHAKFVSPDSSEDLKEITFAFVCVDKGESRKGIFEILMKLHIPFIDVGMGLNRDRGPISGMLRTTLSDADTAAAVTAKQLAPMTDDPDDIYRNNIQIAELNALNACMAVIKYKQIRGFYVDDNNFYHTLLSLNDLHVAGE